MARSDQFPSDALQEIMADLPDWLESSELAPDGVRIASAPLSIWDIQAGHSLSTATTDSSEWHHQLRNTEGAFAFLRSRLVSGHANIIELAESPLVSAIETTLISLREIEGDSTILRLLRSSRHHMTCLWLHRPRTSDEVIILQSQSLRVGLRLGDREFLDKLASLPASGVTLHALRQ